MRIHVFCCALFLGKLKDVDISIIRRPRKTIWKVINGVATPNLARAPGEKNANFFFGTKLILLCYVIN